MKLSGGQKMDIEKICPCCNDRYFKEKDSNEVCSVCGWKNDQKQRLNSDMENGANLLSLNASREKWEVKKSVAVANNYRST